jgi:ABC-type ATPase with predicted acetyltransferase domain
LAEASLFVRPASTLSDGQSYRLAIACALATDPEVLFIDAFCESLDDLSAAAVCKSLRDKSRRTGLTVIAATAAPERLLRAFAPDSVVQLLPGRTHKVMPGDQYLNGKT